LTVSRQTINHELNLLEKQNIIKISFRKIEILDIEKLNLIAKSHT
ncbi:helix-turn-helix domain-containing protein, partial [Acinetobacter baumannii]